MLTRSKFGLGLTILYICVCLAVWADYTTSDPWMLRDMGVMLITLPYWFVAAAVTGRSDFGSLTPTHFALAVAFTSVLVYSFGAVVSKVLGLMFKRR